MTLPKACIEGTHAGQPLSSAADVVLRARLLPLEELVRAAGDGQRGPEAVHQLRVATRRAAVAARVFAELLPRGRRRWLMKELRRIRKAADLARNLDVLAERYAGGNGGAPRWLQKLLARQRAKAQRPLAQLTVRLRRKRFDRRIRALLARIRWRGDGPEPVLMELAQAYLAECTEDLLSLESGAGTSEALHRLRIAGKRLRYALEIFAAVSPEQSERVYPELVALQDQLGTVNDHATAAMLFADFRRAGKARALAELAQREQQSAENAAAQCRSWLAGPSFRALCDALAGFAAEHHADAHAHRPR